MNAAHLHLLTNHLPVLGTFFGLCLLLAALLRKSDELKKASFAVFVIIALLSIPTYLSGEPAEEQVENITGVSHIFLEQHEEAAQIAFTGVLILGSAGLLGLVKYRLSKSVPSWLPLLVLVLAIAVSASMAWTANLGGNIRHSEIRDGNTVSLSESVKDHDEH